MGDPLDHAGPGLDVEASGGPDGDAADMGSGLFPGRDIGPDEIPGLEAEMSLLAGQGPLGNPEASSRVRWVDPRPVALMARTGLFQPATRSTRPTQAASSECPLGIPNRIRFRREVRSLSIPETSPTGCR